MRAVAGVGSVCGINETFTFAGATVFGHGFTRAPAPRGGNVNLTLKPTPLSVLGESGLGVQANNTAITCTDPECEIVPPQSVSATRSGSTLITDALIGSVQAGETFNFFVQNTEGGAFVQLNAGPDQQHLRLPGGLAGGNRPVPLGCSSGSDPFWCGVYRARFPGHQRGISR